MEHCFPLINITLIVFDVHFVSQKYGFIDYLKEIGRSDWEGRGRDGGGRLKIHRKVFSFN